jgi:replicative DNA helicase
VDGRVAPPQNLEAEQMLLASLMDASDNFADATALVEGRDFYREGHRLIWAAMYDLFNGGNPIEPLTVIEQLTKSGTLQTAGGRETILDIIETPYIAASFRTYAEIVRDASVQRRLLRVGQQIEAIVAGREGETDEMVQKAEDLVYGLSQESVRGDFVGAERLVKEGVERLVAASERGAEITGLATGYVDLDRMTGGFRPANLVVVAARPSMGKTALALGMALNAALDDDKTVAIFSIEMSADEIISRMLASAAMVDGSRLRTGRLSQDDWPRIGQAADRLAKASIFIDDSEGVTVAEMRTKARRLKSRHGLDLVIVDYIQLMEGAPGRGRRDESRVQEISAISRGLKLMARDLDVPLICVSQLNRAPDARPDKHPLLSDLRESGAIEQDADVVLMLYRDEYYNKDSEEKGITDLDVAKHRNGPVGRVKLTFMDRYAKFGNLAPDSGS